AVMPSQMSAAPTVATAAAATATISQPMPDFAEGEIIRNEQDLERFGMLTVLVDMDSVNPMDPDAVPKLRMKELDRMGEYLDFTEDQRFMTEALLQGAMSGGFDLVKDMMSGWEDIDWQGNDPEELEKQMENMQNRMVSIFREIIRMLEVFEQDLTSILTEEQMQQWPAYTAGVFRRSQVIYYERPIGIKVDLDVLAREIDPPLDDETEDLVLQQVATWASAADAHVRKLARLTIDEMNSMGDMSAFNDPDNARATAEERMETRTNALSAISDLNFQYYESIRGLIPVERAADFEQSFYSAAMPDLFGPSKADEFADDVLKLETLTGEQRTQIERLQREHKQMMREMNLSIAALERRVTDEMIDVDADSVMWADPDVMLENQRMRGAWDQDFDPAVLEDLERLVESRKSSYERRQRAVKSGINQIVGLLTPDQLNAVEVPPVRPAVSLFAILQRLRNEVRDGSFDDSVREIEFEGGVMYIENRIGRVEYDQEWLDSGDSTWGGKYHDLDWSDDHTPPEEEGSGFGG
ncbi:MAG: hypothetical protein ACOC0P_02720, partial [Planctomycetota bacterium]